MWRYAGRQGIALSSRSSGAPSSLCEPLGARSSRAAAYQLSLEE